MVVFQIFQARTMEDSYLNQVQQRKQTEEFLSRAQQELERFKIQHDDVIERLQEANERNERLLGQLSESREQYDWLLSEHEHLLHDRDRAVREVEELCQRRGQMHSVLVTSTYSEFSSSERLLGQLSESTGQYDWLLSEHDNLLHDRDRVVHEVEELCQRREQMHSVLVTSTYSEFSSSELESATEKFSSSLKIGEGGFACVYRGILRNMTVAIKVLKPDCLQGRSQFEQEVIYASHPEILLHPCH